MFALWTYIALWMYEKMVLLPEKVRLQTNLSDVSAYVDS